MPFAAGASLRWSPLGFFRRPRGRRVRDLHGHLADQRRDSPRRARRASRERDGALDLRHPPSWRSRLAAAHRRDFGRGGHSRERWSVLPIALAVGGDGAWWSGSVASVAYRRPATLASRPDTARARRGAAAIEGDAVQLVALGDVVEELDEEVVERRDSTMAARGAPDRAGRRLRGRSCAAMNASTRG